MKKLLLSVFSALLLQLAFPPFNIWPAGWIGFVPLLYALYDSEPLQAVQSGFVFGIFYFFSNQYWIYYSLNQFGNMPLITALSVVMLLSIYQGLYVMAFSFLISKLNKKGVSLLYTAPVLWTAFEFLRGHLFTGFPWSLAGYTQWSNTYMLQISDITSIYGVSFVVILFNAFLTELIHFYSSKKQNYLVLKAITVFIIIGLTFIYGLYRVNQIENQKKLKSIKIALIQGNIDQDKKWDLRYQKDVLNTYFNLTRKAVKDSKPDLIIWPETALPFYYGSEKELTDELVGFVKELSIPLLTGSMLVKELKIKEDGSYEYGITNSAILLDSDGKLTYIYDKIHLVPFGEYVPLRRFLFFLDKLVSVGIGDFKQGKSYVKGRVKDLDIATVICYEAIFPDLVRKFFIDGGDIIVNISNDAWFGETIGPLQHYQIATVRSIENRKPLIRVTNSGISGIIDQAGRTLKTLGLFKRGYITFTLEIKNINSLYSRIGDLFGYFSLLYSTIVIIIFLRR
ncbi:MAG: apolipoprotein N-acyltransferase [Nitrospirae bacterium]|nr:apolipoprotein N-acyltransferase [Nitrospirota bacterium]